MPPTSWRLAGALKALKVELDKQAPLRSRAFDGSIGDAAHAARSSAHNPNERGVVCAIDITHDPDKGCDAQLIAETIRVHQDRRVSHVIWNHRIFSSTIQPWQWRLYQGSNPHTKHIHVAVNDELADDYPWFVQ